MNVAAGTEVLAWESMTEDMSMPVTTRPASDSVLLAGLPVPQPISRTVARLGSWEMSYESMSIIRFITLVECWAACPLKRLCLAFVVDVGILVGLAKVVV